MLGWGGLVRHSNRAPIPHPELDGAFLQFYPEVDLGRRRYYRLAEWPQASEMTESIRPTPRPNIPAGVQRANAIAANQTSPIDKLGVGADSAPSWDAILTTGVTDDGSTALSRRAMFIPARIPMRPRIVTRLGSRAVGR